MPDGHRLKTQTRRARQLRRQMTEPEVYVWLELKGRQLGVKFRRQVPIGPYVVDFLCHERRLIVELDGSQHGGPADDVRERYLSRQGLRVLRIWNDIVYEDIEQAILMIKAHL